MNFGADEQQQTLLETTVVLGINLPVDSILGVVELKRKNCCSSVKQNFTQRHIATSANVWLHAILPKYCKGPPNRSSTQTTLAGFLIQQMDLVILNRIASGICFPTVKMHNNKNAQK
ncbi:hypothetical protein T12_4151 [Trichinella patagoniensis]|uniref:Uncharacterized protein n=1 Tax=Trichinella patagoniensis TaxID=990121 RepID=A0A0V0ZAT1_9BILA|nr:hypothetical protein T12_4151 [Trichinella patagoniensis]